MAMTQPRSRAALNETLYDYLQATQPPEHGEQVKLRELTRQLPRWRMQISREQGHFLTFLVRLIGARRTLEIGTFTGFSALTVALALPPDGKVVGCDISDEWVNVGRPFWKAAGVDAKIEIKIGPALDTLQQFERDGESFDLAFIDADKENMDAYYESSLKLVRVGGLIVLDNMFQRGTVADDDDSDPRTAIVRTLNAKIAKDDRVDRVLLPVGDGMTLVRRID